MSVNYSTNAINDRLLGVVTAIGSGGSGGSLKLLAGGTIVSTIALQNPCGTVAGGILTFIGTLLDPAAANTGNVDGGRIDSSDGLNQVFGLTAGIPGSGADIIINNGLNSTLISAGQVVSLVSAQITGS